MALCWLPSLSLMTPLSLILQFGSSFATFRPALSHSGSTKSLSVILPIPASLPYNCPPGSSSSSPTSKVPVWKVCSPFTPMASVLHVLCFTFNIIQLMPKVCICFTLHHQITHSLPHSFLCSPNAFTSTCCVCVYFIYLFRLSHSLVL